MVMVKVVHQLALGPEFAREVRAVLSANLEPIPTSLPRPPHCPRTHMLSAKARYRVDGILERLNVKTWRMVQVVYLRSHVRIHFARSMSQGRAKTTEPR